MLSFPAFSNGIDSPTSPRLSRWRLAMSWSGFALLQGLMVFASLGTIFLMRELAYLLDSLLRATSDYVGTIGYLLILFRDRPIFFFVVTVFFRLCQLWVHARVLPRNPARAWGAIAIMTLFEITLCLSVLVTGMAFVMLNHP